MLGTIIEKLSSLLSKGAFLASFVPLLAFVVANGALLAAVYYPFRKWILEEKTNAELISAAVILFLAGSLIFASINPRLRELLEGKFWPRSVCGAFTASENRRLNNLNKEYSSLQKNQRSLERKNDEWTRSLKAARAAEPKNPRRKYDPSGKAASM